ncbi:helix-turn-helix transcriptional regulator [Jannaschia sp. Os4]|uniref:ArsR/SmtB family transcription factor n=1 Tax=Jannaschia sp. Os4 TaxID=2807617 RepID=UPI00193949F0|nr:metalloregulator ArsR/SmtB family transcription factor [Jannaschia sp. Os4]MBM2576290.1 helix-turn-helix transcriptional regulator [Jannaschia sp. Os4]
MTDLVNANVFAGSDAGPMAALEQRAQHVASRLAEAANPKRLLILCHLAKRQADAPEGADGEASVGELQAVVGLSQSALSQHLARLRAAGMVATRRDGLVIHYRLADDETRALMRALYETFCA